MSLTKLSLARENWKLWLVRSPLETRKTLTFFYSVVFIVLKKDAKNDLLLKTACDIVPLLIFNLEQHTKKPRDERGAGECGSRHLKWFIQSTSHPSPLVLGSWGE